MGFTLRDFTILSTAGMRTVSLALTPHGSAAAAMLARMESPLVTAAESAMEGLVAVEATVVEFSTCLLPLTQPPMMAVLGTMLQEVAKAERERASEPSRAHRRQRQQQKGLP